MPQTPPSDLSAEIGSSDYYVARHNDFKARHPKQDPPRYYLGYGCKYLDRFHELSPRLTDAGAKWVGRTTVLLQRKIEDRRHDGPIEFDDLEQHEDQFKTFAFETHPTAYLEAGLGKLPAEDVILIAGTPDAGDLLSNDGIAQVVKTALAVVMHNGPTRNAKLVTDAMLFLATELAIRGGNQATDALAVLSEQAKRLWDDLTALPAAPSLIPASLLKILDSTVRLASSPGEMNQGWRTLGFCSWQLRPEQVRPLVPPELELDLRDGHAWVSMVPMRMVNVGPPEMGAVLPPFAEINLRTYVRYGDRAGVYFLSLDCPQAMVNVGAKVLFGLPYVLSMVSLIEQDGWLLCESERLDPSYQAARLRCRYRPTGTEAPVAPGSLAQFLVERYALFTVDSISRDVHRGDIKHDAWTVTEGELVIDENTVPSAAGLPIDRAPDHFCYSAKTDTTTLPFVTVG
jgi:uncharacterized protein YqjF (DUF2071 family)